MNMYKCLTSMNQLDDLNLQLNENIGFSYINFWFREFDDKNQTLLKNRITRPINKSVLTASLSVLAEKSEKEFRLRLVEVLKKLAIHLGVVSEVKENFSLATEQRILAMIFDILDYRKDTTISDYDRSLVNYFAKDLFNDIKFNTFMYSNSVQKSVHIRRKIYQSERDIYDIHETYTLEEKMYSCNALCERNIRY